MSYFVKRTRTQDNSSAYAMGFRNSNVGQIQYSRTFPTTTTAEREANAWRQTGDWNAEVVEGRAPRKS